MLNPPPSIVASRRSARGGFTLVELLVVIGIIAILAGVALGPITRGIKQAKQSSGMQTCRTIGLAEFAFSNDNSQAYPDISNCLTSTASGAGAVAQALLIGGYVNDYHIFNIGAGNAAPYSGSSPSTGVTAAMVSFDFAGMTTGLGINSNAPDSMPVVWSSVAGSSGTEPTSIATVNAAIVAQPNTSAPYGNAGVAVAYKSNSAKFVISAISGTTANATLVDATYPGFTNATILSGGG
jgi:prepilin-type N-terminal cleavage/methylation domain-containing protein